MSHSDRVKISRNCWEKQNAEGSKIREVYEKVKTKEGKTTRCPSKGYFEMKICYHKIKKSGKR